MSATVRSLVPVGGGLTRVSLDVPEDRRASYAHAGQYVEVTIDAARGYFALAGPIGAPTWELLVRSSGGASEALLARGPGAVVDVSPALGRGFPDVALGAERLVVAVAGSAIAIAPPIVARRGAGSTHLYVGVRTPADTPLLDELRAWRARGFAVTLCASRAIDGEVGLPVTKAYVQDAIARDRATIGAPATVLAAGPDGLVAAVRALGGDDLSVYTNV